MTERASRENQNWHASRVIVVHTDIQNKDALKTTERTTTKLRERSVDGRMRNDQSLPNKRISSNNVNGRQLPSSSPLHSSCKNRTRNRSSQRYQKKIEDHSQITEARSDYILETTIKKTTATVRGVITEVAKDKTTITQVDKTVTIYHTITTIIQTLHKNQKTS